MEISRHNLFFVLHKLLKNLTNSQYLVTFIKNFIIVGNSSKIPSIEIIG